jgi:hypothetical protein
MPRPSLVLSHQLALGLEQSFAVAVTEHSAPPRIGQWIGLTRRRAFTAPGRALTAQTRSNERIGSSSAAWAGGMLHLLLSMPLRRFNV